METTIPWEKTPLVSYDELTDMYSYHPTTTITGTSSTWIDPSKISITSIPTFATDTQLSDAREELNKRIDALERQSVEHKNKIELHIEELEQDIDYFEDKRHESDDEIFELKTQISAMQSYIDAQRSIIEQLSVQIRDMEVFIRAMFPQVKEKEVENEC